MGSYHNAPNNDVRVIKGLKILESYKLLRPLLLTTCFGASPLRGEIKNDETSSFTTLNKSYIRFGEEDSFRCWFKEILSYLWGFKILFLLFLVTINNEYVSGYGL